MKGMNLLGTMTRPHNTTPLVRNATSARCVCHRIYPRWLWETRAQLVPSNQCYIRFNQWRFARRCFAANGYGLYDTAGNVWELCWDWFSSTITVRRPRLTRVDLLQAHSAVCTVATGTASLASPGAPIASASTCPAPPPRSGFVV